MRAWCLVFVAFFCLWWCSSSGATANGPRHWQQQEEERGHAGQRLLQLSETYAAWVTYEQMLALVEVGVHFVDITYSPLLGPRPDIPQPQVPRADRQHPSIQNTTRRLAAELSSEKIKEHVVMLSSFPTRYYTSETGLKAAQALHETYRVYAGDNSHISVHFFEHSWLQPSVIARIDGHGDHKDELVIIGGHEDSIAFGREEAPGADDDGSGSATVLEVFRVLAKNGFKPNRTIEFHAYAAEEVGLLGSRAIASAYQQDGKVVAGMLQLDMVGYVRPGTEPAIGLVTDGVSKELTAFVRELGQTYTSLPVKNTACGYGCSDHYSWTQAGYRSAFPFESLFADSNPYIHSSADTVDKLDFHHAKEFAKLALAFAVHLSSPEA